MSYEPKSGALSMFRNKNKEKDTHPDYNVKIHLDAELIAGLQAQLDQGKDLAVLYGGAWVKQNDSIGTFLSGQVQLPRDKSASVESVEDVLKPTPVQTGTPEPQKSITPDDDLPF